MPRALQEQLGKRERVCSTGTSDAADATRRSHPILTRWQAEFKKLEELKKLKDGDQRTTANIPAIVVDRVYRPVLEMLESHRRNLPDDDAIYAQALAERRTEQTRLARWRQDGMHGEWEVVADRIIKTCGLPFAKGSEAYGSLVSAVADNTIDAYSVHNRQSAGDIDAEPKTKVVRDALEAEAKTAPSGEKLIDLFERYAAQRLAEKRKRPDTINQDRKVIESFAEFVGDTRKVTTINGDDVRDWIDTVAVLPPNFRKIKAYQGLDLRAAVKKAQDEGAKGPALTTLNKYLSTVSPLFVWLKKRNYHQGTNPCDGLFNDVPKNSNPRPPFSTDQLNTILGSPLFTGFQANGKEHCKGNCRADDWRYWVPIVCLFTGARLGEIAQLRTEDVRLERGVWFIHIRHDESTGQTTKSGLSRAAPVHCKLVDLGFLAFHKRQAQRAAADGSHVMFPELKKNARDQISGKVGRWWRRYLERIGVKQAREGGDGFGSHSFRHTLADRLRDEADLLDNQIEVTLGHNQKTTTSGYGRLKQGTVTLLKSYFDAVTFEGVDFSALS